MKPLARRALDPPLLEPYTRVDLRVAKDFNSGAYESELSLTVQNAFEEHQDTRLKNLPKRRAYLSYRLKFK